MDRTETLNAALAALELTAARVEATLAALPDLSGPTGNGCTWPVRQVAVHLIGGLYRYTEIANGMPSPLPGLRPEQVAAFRAASNFDVPESAPDKVAALLRDAAARFPTTLAGRPGDQPVVWHGGVEMDLAALVAILLDDWLLHGFDVACGIGVPWPIDAAHATLALDGLLRGIELLVEPSRAAGHNARYRIALRGGPSYALRFVEGTPVLESPEGPADCELSVDPVAFLLVFAGRMSWWTAVALGLVVAGGDRPELANSLAELLYFP